MEKEGTDGYWIVKPENIRYLTGFRGNDSTLLATGGRYILLTDRRYGEEAQNEGGIDEVLLRDTSMAVAARDLCKKKGLKNLCIVARHVTCADYKDISEKNGGMKVSLRNACLVESFRRRKSACEIECIKRAIKTADDGFSRFKKHVKSGRSERWLARRLEWEMCRAGADGAAFDAICAISENASSPHARPSERELKKGDSLLVDWGARVNGYMSDITRMLAPGNIPDKTTELAEIVLSARLAALDVIKPGIEAWKVDAAARNVIEDAGYGECFSHGLGHGIGLEVHEAPHLAPGQRDILEAGMVMTFEPAIYLTGRCGVRIEDMVCITLDGYEILGSELPHSPIPHIS